MIAAILILLSAGQGQAAKDVDLSADPELAAKVELRLKNVPLTQALKDLDEATDSTVALASNLSNLKLTVFVRDEPCWKVMNRIAEVLGCNWEAEKHGYRLVMRGLAQAELRAYLQAEDALLRKVAENQVNELVRKTTPSEDELKKQREDLGRANKETAAARQDLNFGLNDRNRLLGNTFRGFSQADWSAFWQGKVFYIRGGDAEKPLTVAVQYNPSFKRLLVDSTSGPEGALMGIERVVLPVPFNKPQLDLETMPFAQKVMAWPTPVETLDADASLKIPFKSDKPVPESPFYRKFRTLADFLEVVFDATDRPIVAEGFRTIAGYNGLKATNLRAWIKETTEYFPSFIRVDDNWLLVRHGGFWRRRSFEPPEAAMTALETKAEKGPLVLSDYAEFAGKLDMTQAMAFRTGMSCVSKFSPKPLEDAMLALRFYSTLNERQRKAAFTVGVSAGALGGPQRDLLVQAISMGVFYGADKESWNSGLLGSNAPIADLVFLVSGERVWPGGRPLPGGRIVNGTASRSPEDQKVPGTRFLFGITPEKRVAFTTPTPP